MARNRNGSVDLDERRRHATEFVRSLPPAPEHGPLSDEERAGIEATVRRFTERRGHGWHGRVMWARSPSEFDELIVGAPDLLAAKGDRIARRVSVVGRVVLRALHVLLWLLCHVSAWAVVVLLPLALPWIFFVFWYLSSLLFDLAGWLRPRRWNWTTSRPRIRPLRVRMPRAVQPGTPESRAWMPRELLGTAGPGPDGRVVLAAAGCRASSVQEGEFVGGPCGRSTDLYPVRFREPPARVRQAFDGHLRPHELAWLLERREITPRRKARSLLRTHAQLERAFAVRMYRDRAVVLEPPVRFRTERLPDGKPRLHCDDGPAVVWASGERLYVVHGVVVPEDLVERGWDVERIEVERNSEVRRIAVERIGWAAYVHEAGLRSVARAPDPANADRSLRLFAIPGVGAHVLLMTNGSPDRSGAIREYAELVPSWIDDPVAAAAWQYGVPAETYQQLQRRT